jgi:hypothetical protein
MLKQYLQKAPTLIVIGVTAYAAWPTVFPDGDSGQTKEASKPPTTARASASDVADPGRNPFQLDRPAAVEAATPSKAVAPASSAVVVRPAGLPDLPADEDQVLSGMRLGGTFIHGREQLAVINNRVYARGEQLRGADGSLLPYVISQIGKDRAILRRGRRDVVLAFSNVPRAASPKAGAPGAPALAKLPPPLPTAKPASAGVETAARRKDGPPSSRSGRDPGDPSTTILQLLSGVGGSAGVGGSPASGSLAVLGTASGLAPGSPGLGINSDTLSAGLDALVGKLDNIGRDGGDSPLSAPGGGTTP